MLSATRRIYRSMARQLPMKRVFSAATSEAKLCDTWRASSEKHVSKHYIAPVLRTSPYSVDFNSRRKATGAHHIMPLAFCHMRWLHSCAVKPRMRARGNATVVAYGSGLPAASGIAHSCGPAANMREKQLSKTRLCGRLEGAMRPPAPHEPRSFDAIRTRFHLTRSQTLTCPVNSYTAEHCQPREKR